MISAQTTSANRLMAAAANMTPKTRWTTALLFPLVVGPVWCLGWFGHGGRIGTLTGLVLLATLAVSAVTDFNRHRIYNWTTYSAFLWAIVINVAASVGVPDGTSLVPAFQSAATVGPTMLGGVGIGECLAGAGICFLITLFGYDLSGGGAGDVKLATVIGALLGVHDGMFAVGYSYVVAAVVIIAWSTYKHGPLALLLAGLRSIAKLAGPLSPFRTTSDDRKLLLTPVPLGPYFAVGTLLVALGLVPT
jgi:Flp pilus assembly protein protease CpaA